MISASLVCAILMAGFPKASLAAPATLSTEGGTENLLVPPQLKNEVVLEYPEEAAEQGLHGNVSVLVQVASDGAVISVVFERGPAVFERVALEAAGRLQFEPALLDGVPVTATTRVRFHFAPHSGHGDVPMAEYIVHGNNPDLEDTRARTTLTEETLESAAGRDLAQTVEAVPGVRMATGTNASAKPIIRGHQERRLLVLYDGVRHESQKWGPDHATEIDPFAAGSVSVIRGAAGARYGPDAIGGVILVEPPPLRSTAGTGGTLRTAFSSNGLRPYGALRVDSVPSTLPKLTFRLEGNAAQSTSLHAPGYVLGNTASTIWNAGSTIGYRLASGELRLTLHHYDQRAGLFYGIQNSSPDEFEAQLQKETPVNAGLWTSTREIDRPMQDVTHDIATAALELSGSAGTLEATYAYQHNRRREYEQVRQSITGAQYDFTLRTHSVDALYEHHPAEIDGGSLEGGVGMQGSFQENVYQGYSLLPNYRSFAGGLYASERMSRPRLDLEIGARYDTMHRATYLGQEEYEQHLSEGTLQSDSCEEGPGRTRCPSRLQTGSASLGGVFHLVPDRLDLKVDLYSASRFPNIDEQFLLGYAPSFPVYGVGLPALETETAWGGSLTMGLRVPWLTGELSGHGSYVHDYIYFAPVIGEDGSPIYDVTIRGTWPRYEYSPVQASFYGVDGLLSFAPDATVGLDVRGATVRGLELESGAHLIGIPADHLSIEGVLRMPPMGAARGGALRVQAEVVGAQSRSDPQDDFAPAPDAYSLLGVSGELEIDAGPMPLRMGVDIHNLLDASYREYLSLLRYYADQPGRDVRLWLGADF
jgi:iron complex outermembrane recepter protein